MSRERDEAADAVEGCAWALLGLLALLAAWAVW